MFEPTVFPEPLKAVKKWLPFSIVFLLLLPTSCAKEKSTQWWYAGQEDSPNVRRVEYLGNGKMRTTWEVVGTIPVYKQIEQRIVETSDTIRLELVTWTEPDAGWVPLEEAYITFLFRFEQDTTDKRVVALYDYHRSFKKDYKGNESTTEELTWIEVLEDPSSSVGR